MRRVVPRLTAVEPQASLAADDFTLFGLPRRYALDASALDAKWKALQGAAHPDRHAGDTPAARRLAMQWAVRINEAHRRLRDPLARAAYLCALAGHDVEAESNTAMPVEFLMQQMAWRESLAEAEGVHEVEALGAQVEQVRTGLHADLGAAIDQAVAVDWPTVAGGVRRLMFIDRFLSDVDRKLE